MSSALPIRHIGYFKALCDGRRAAHLRPDLGADRYRRLGTKERFRGEAPYRICERCIAKVEQPFSFLKGCVPAQAALDDAHQHQRKATMNARPKQPLTTPLAEIEAKAKRYADDRAELAELVHDLIADKEALTRKAMPAIKRALAEAAESHAELRTLIECFPGSFAKPRTQIFHGIKVGYRKGTGKVTYEDAERVVALIKKHLDDQAELLIATVEKPNKEAIAGLDVADLKKIGCAIEGTGDVVEIRPVDSGVEKAVKALLKEAIDEEGGQ